VHRLSVREPVELELRDHAAERERLNLQVRLGSLNGLPHPVRARMASAVRRVTRGEPVVLELSDQPFQRERLYLEILLRSSHRLRRIGCRRVSRGDAAKQSGRQYSRRSQRDQRAVKTSCACHPTRTRSAIGNSRR